MTVSDMPPEPGAPRRAEHRDMQGEAAERDVYLTLRRVCW